MQRQAVPRHVRLFAPLAQHEVAQLHELVGELPVVSASRVFLPPCATVTGEVLVRGGVVNARCIRTPHVLRTRAAPWQEVVQ